MRPNCPSRRDFEDFQRFFGIKANKFLERIGPYTSFDVIKFDKWLKVPDGVSTANHIESKFGKEAKELVRKKFLSLF